VWIRLCTGGFGLSQVPSACVVVIARRIDVGRREGSGLALLAVFGAMHVAAPEVIELRRTVGPWHHQALPDLGALVVPERTAVRTVASDLPFSVEC
jgi:hypothetical protein